MEKRLKIAKSSINDAVLFMVVLMTVLLSKSYYFGVANRGFYQYVYYAVVALGGAVVGLRRKRINKAGLVVLPLEMILAFSILINQSDMSGSDINQVFGVIIIFVCVSFTASYMSIGKFAKYYIKIISVLCMISIPCFIITLVNRDLALSLCQPGYDWTVPVGYSFFYTWGWNGVIFHRNSGVFWEPGAFQGFIILALLMLLFNCDGTTIRHRKSVLCLLVVTLLTTQSSTGYILLVLVLLTQWRRIQNILGDVNVALRNCLAAMIVIGGVYIVVSSGNISSKLSSVSSDSAIIRLSDLLGGAIMVIKGGLVGFGETTIRNANRVLYGVSSNDSIGLFAMAYTYGIIFAGYYIWMMIKGVCRYFDISRILDVIVIVSTFIILHMTEGLWALPVYIAIPVIGITGGLLAAIIHLWASKLTLCTLPISSNLEVAV